MYMWNLKYGTNKPIYKAETDSETQRTDLWLPWGREMGGGMDWKVGMSGQKLIWTRPYCTAQGTIFSIL